METNRESLVKQIKDQKITKTLNTMTAILLLVGIPSIFTIDALSEVVQQNGFNWGLLFSTSLMLMMTIPLALLFFVSNQKDRKRANQLIEILQSKTEDELVKIWVSEERIPLVKVSKGLYIKPGQPGYKEVEATKFYKTEAEALQNLYLPANF